MLYPIKLQKQASIQNMGAQVANFFKNLSVPSSINNAIRPQIFKQLGANNINVPKVAKIGLGLTAGGAVGNMAFNAEQNQQDLNNQWQSLQ